MRALGLTLLLFFSGLVSCTTTPRVVSSPEIGTPVGTPTPVTLVMEVPETLLERTLANLSVCTARTFGPYHEDPANTSSRTFSTTFHVRAKGPEGVTVRCSTDGGATWQPNFNLVNGGDAARTGCTTPSGHPIYARLN